MFVSAGYLVLNDCVVHYNRAVSGAGGGISACEAPDDQVRGPDGVLRYKIAPATEALLQRFFAPYNQKLFDVLADGPAKESKPSPTPRPSQDSLTGTPTPKRRTSLSQR